MPSSSMKVEVSKGSQGNARKKGRGGEREKKREGKHLLDELEFWIPICSTRCIDPGKGKRGGEKRKKRGRPIYLQPPQSENCGETGGRKKEEEGEKRGKTRIDMLLSQSTQKETKTQEEKGGKGGGKEGGPGFHWVSPS